jgi:tetratricopeptide (TPR) repeat protein
MRRFSVLGMASVLALIAVGLTGCSRDPNVRKRKYLESGQRYSEKGKYREAAIQFSNAVQVDPRYAEAHYQLAQTYLKLQGWLRAYQELERTLQLEPDNYQARIDLANLLIAGRDLKQAQEHTDLLLQQQPNNSKVHLAAANLLAAQENLPGAIEEMHTAIALAPGSAQSYMGLAILEMRSNQFDAAENDFKKSAELDPKALEAQVALGSFYQSRNRLPEAEQQFRHAIDVDPKNPDPRASLVRLLMAEGKKTEAEEFLKQSKHDLADNAVGYRMLGDFYFATGDLDKATAEYGLLFNDHPKDVQVKKNYVQLLILKNRLDEANKLNDELLKANPKETDSLIYRGQIQIRQGRARDAIQTLEGAIKNDPENGIAHYHLGIACDQLGDLSRSENEWRRAVQLRPDLYDAQRALAAVELRKGDMAGLEQTALQIITLQPASPDGYALRAISFGNRQQFGKAELDAQKAIEMAPNSPVGYLQTGNLRMAQKKYLEAEKFYRQALDREPSSSDSLAGLMNTYLAEKQPDKAVAAANAQISKVPRSSAFYDLLGTVLVNNKKDLNGAEAALNKAAELDRNNSDALLKLGQVQVAKGSTDQAIATYQNSIKDNPREASFYILMGELYESKQDWTKAKDLYQQALTIKPDNPLASNNLAYVMLQSGGNVDVALSLAQTARRGLPDSPNAADTLGWVYYQKGAYKSAIDLFQEALRLNEKASRPDDANFHYHLGLAYQKTDQPALAKKELERVLKANPNYSDAGDVKRLLAQLR